MIIRVTALVVHVIPRSVFSNAYHGSYKDTISRVRFFESSNLAYRQVLMDVDDPLDILDSAKGSRKPAFLIEYCGLPKSLKALRKHYPESFIAIRAHNIEPLQHLNNYGWWSGKGPLWVLYGMARLYAADLVMKRHASAIFSISDWESRVYWRWLPGRARVEWLPYFCPDHLLSHEQLAPVERCRIVCMPTSQKNRKSWDLVTRFIEFAECMKQLTGNRYEYLVTGDVAHWNLPASRAVQFSGMLTDLRTFMPTVKAVALLSDKGYGFKTTISDAIANGAVVLAHPRLASRCPEGLQQAIFPIDVRMDESLDSLVDHLGQSDSHACLDRALRETNLGMLREYFAAEREAVNGA